MVEADFDLATSTVGTWQQAAAPLQGGGIAGFPGAPDLLGGIGTAGNGENLVTTYLFRNSFTLDAAAAAQSNWRLRYLADDGAIIYVNGTEVFRTENMPGGEVETTTLAPFLPGAEDAYTTAEVDLSGVLVPGANSVAVEVHQSSLNSSDVGFDLSIEPVASAGVGVFVYVDDPFPARYQTDAPDFSAGDIDDDGGFAGAGLHAFVGSGPRLQLTVSSGAWRLPVVLSNPATLEFSFATDCFTTAGTRWVRTLPFCLRSTEHCTGRTATTTSIASPATATGDRMATPAGRLSPPRWSWQPVRTWSISGCTAAGPLPLASFPRRGSMTC